MNKFLKILFSLLAILMISVFAVIQEAKVVTAAPPAQEGPVNQLFIDATYNPQTKAYSIGGFTQAQLAQVGVTLPDQVLALLGSFNQVTLKINGATLDVLADEAKLATLNWDKASRAWLYGMIDNFSQMPPLDQQRAEAWLDKADIQLVVRQSTEISKPLVIDLNTIVNVDVAKDGKVKVEGFDTGSMLPAQVTSLLDAAKVQDMTVCWSKGVLKNKVNGADIPALTLYQEGVSVVDKAFGLNLGDLGQLFQSQLGANVAYGGGMHTDSQCGD
ncbi:MAG TPA: hypothetical protein VLR89_04110 [Anaerolineaceae bacterium]|nr:hypothetical protein [Anaerolineaceae bacterium]